MTTHTLVMGGNYCRFFALLMCPTTTTQRDNKHKMIQNLILKVCQAWLYLELSISPSSCSVHCTYLKADPCNFKLTYAISSEPVQFHNNCVILTYEFCTVAGNSHTIMIITCANSMYIHIRCDGELELSYLHSPHAGVHFNSSMPLAGASLLKTTFLQVDLNTLGAGGISVLYRHKNLPTPISLV